MAPVRIVPADRRPPIPLWALAIVAFWLALVAAHEVLTPPQLDQSACLFRRATGVPCVTCGSTRATLAIFSGDVRRGFLENPFMVAAGLLAAAWLLVRTGFGATVRLELPRRQRVFAWVALAGLVLANWAYVIVHNLR